MYANKHYLALSNLQWVICNKTLPNQSKISVRCGYT